MQAPLSIRGVAVLLSCSAAHRRACGNGSRSSQQLLPPGSQVAELAAFVRARGAGSSAGVVLAGDLNCAPDTLEFAMLKVGSVPICGSLKRHRARVKVQPDCSDTLPHAGLRAVRPCNPTTRTVHAACPAQVLLPELQDAWAQAQPLLLGATANALESSFTSEPGLLLLFHCTVLPHTCACVQRFHG